MKKYIVGISACTAGIAHTYMAAEALMKAGKQRGDDIRIETQGCVGAEDVLTSVEIERADVVIIAADVDVDVSRFIKKKIYKIKTIDAIKDSDAVIEKALKECMVHELKNASNQENTSVQKDTMMTHILSGLSYMGVLCLVAGLLFAVSSISANTSGGTWIFDSSNGVGLYMSKLYEGAVASFQLAIPLFAGFMAKSIADKPAIAPAMIGAYMANQPSYIAHETGGGFLSALLIALIAGYTVKLLKRIPWPKLIASTMSFIIIPFISTLFILFLVVFVIGNPMAIVVKEFYHLLIVVEHNSLLASFIIGAILGGMVGYDFGGPLNKVAMIFAIAVFADTINIFGIAKADFIPQTATQAAVSIAPISIWLSSKLCRNKFTEQEHQLAKGALRQGIMGISEGAIPFMKKDTRRTRFSSVCGSAVAGGLVSVVGCKFYGGIGSILGTFVGYIEQPIPFITWILCLSAGILVSSVIFLLMRRNVNNNVIDERMKA